jgi:hypothetical protein
LLGLTRDAAGTGRWREERYISIDAAAAGSGRSEEDDAHEKGEERVVEKVKEEGRGGNGSSTATRPGQYMALAVLCVVADAVICIVGDAKESEMSGGVQSASGVRFAAR